MKKFLFLCIPFFLFSGCTSSEPSNVGQLENLVEKQRELQQEKSAYFSLEKKEDNIYQIILHNPKKEAIQTVKFSIIYPRHLVKIGSFTNTSEEIFSLLLEKNITKEMISVSMGKDGKAIPLNEKIILGEISLEKKSDSPFQFSFFNKEKGNNIMIVKDKKVIDILNIENLKNITVQ